MSTEVFESINELKKVFAPNAHLFTVINEKDVPELLSAAKSSRDKMIEILNRFYKEHNRNSDGVDDFVTLFGVYCNYYLLYGLHLILKEDDFGTSKIFENIADNSLKKYLSLIRSGIYTQDVTHFEEAVKTNKNYSLAHFYLFLYYLRKYWNRRDAEPEKKLLEHYKAIRNDKLKKYVLALPDFVSNIGSYIIKTWKNYLASILLPLFGSKAKEMANELTGLEDESLEAPPLPCPYLLTTEELQRMMYLLCAISLWSNLWTIYNLFNETEPKDFSDTLLFIANEQENWADEEETRSNLLRFFAEHEIDSTVAILICKIIFVLPIYLEEAKKFFRNITQDNLNNFNFKDSSAYEEQILMELEKIYWNKKPMFSEVFDTMENSKAPIDKIGNKYMFERSSFLEIPCLIKWTNRELSNLMERLVAEDEKDTMVRDFMHVYSNMAASNLYDIAQLLLKRDNPEDKKTGRKLLLEYALKKELSNSVYIMQLMYKDNVADLKKMISESLVGAEDDSESVSDVLNKALRQCFINIFYGDPSERAGKKGKVGKMHKNLKKTFGKNFPENKREQFEQQFMEQDFNCLAWLMHEGINFTFEQDPVWEKIFMERDGFSSTFLKVIFDELCVNAFKYGDMEREIRLCLSKDESNDLVISFENRFTRSRTASGSQIGVDLLRRRIQILHEDAKKNCVEVVDDKIRGIFRIKLILPAALFLAQSS